MIHDFNLIMKNPEFKDSFNSTWGPALIAYAKAMKSPTVGVQRALRDCNDEYTFTTIIVEPRFCLSCAYIYVHVYHTVWAMSDFMTFNFGTHTLS